VDLEFQNADYTDLERVSAIRDRLGWSGRPELAVCRPMQISLAFIESRDPKASPPIGRTAPSRDRTTDIECDATLLRKRRASDCVFERATIADENDLLNRARQSGVNECMIEHA
jgi:hypothetical protein